MTAKKKTTKRKAPPRQGKKKPYENIEMKAVPRTKKIESLSDLTKAIKGISGMKLPRGAHQHYIKLVKLHGLAHNNGDAEAVALIIKEAEGVRKALNRVRTGPTVPLPDPKLVTKGRSVRKPRVYKGVAPSAASTKKHTCLCGCGGETRERGKSRGLFLPGHDATLKSKAKKVAAGEFPESCMSPIARSFCARWNALSDEVSDTFRKKHERITKWNESKLGRSPKTFAELEEQLGVK